MEIRYMTPYVSGLNWVLNDPINEAIPVQNDGVTTVRQLVRQPGFRFEITPYLGNIPSKTLLYDFDKTPTSGPGADDVLAAAGVDVRAAWATALDSMANVFPILQDPEAGTEIYGIPCYLRLDAWRAILPWEGEKSVLAILGAYDSLDYTDVQAYIQLVFADGSVLRNRERQKAELQNTINEQAGLLATPPVFPGWENLTTEQRTNLVANAPAAKLQAEKNLAFLNSQLVAPLSSLLGISEVQTSIGALVAGAFSVLKANDPMWAGIDVAAVMSRFTLPSVE